MSCGKSWFACLPGQFPCMPFSLSFSTNRSTRSSASECQCAAASSVCVLPIPGVFSFEARCQTASRESKKDNSGTSSRENSTHRPPTVHAACCDQEQIAFKQINHPLDLSCRTRGCDFVRMSKWHEVSDSYMFTVIIREQTTFVRGIWLKQSAPTEQPHNNSIFSSVPIVSLSYCPWGETNPTV